MADAPRYGYNAAGQWTLLQPGEAEWDPSKALETLYGKDNSSLLGTYYQAGGNFANTGGLLMNSQYASPGTSINDTVYNYTRPYTEEEQAGIRNAQGEWTNMFLNSPVYNKNGANSYQIQSETPNLTRNNVSDNSRWNKWATTNNYIAPTTTSNNTGNTIGNQQRVNPATVTNPTGNTSTQTTTAKSPYLSRMSDKSAFSGAPMYSATPLNSLSSSQTGLQSASNLNGGGTSINQRKPNMDYSKALWR